ncbi:MAG: metal dependent phosphohydrolase [Bryobacterales bacterium]|nr:metal dependent phosphohydrolase [Bryobacterales bacterium]
MKSPYINELEINKPVTASFLVQSKEIREKKTGEPYLSLLLGDKTGKVDAKMWDNVAEVMDAFDRDHFVKVKGLVQLHLNRPQLTIHKIRVLADHEVDFADYFPASTRNRDEMWAELRATVAQVGDAHIRDLLDALLDDEDVAKRYRVAPAAKSIHHAYLGGLLEHVLSLCKLCKLTSAHYPHIDADLMIAGAVLHDIGKIYELTYDRGFGYSTEGQLLGHMMIALRMISDKLRALPDFPAALRTMLEHMVISHHGKLEFGSPKLPLFPEALLLHYLDDMDSKMESMRHLIDSDRQSDGCFTSYNPALERTVFKKDRFLAPPSPKQETAPAAPAQGTARPPVPPPVPPKPASTSPFAEKLQLALVHGPSADSKA